MKPEPKLSYVFFLKMKPLIRGPEELPVPFSYGFQIYHHIPPIPILDNKALASAHVLEFVLLANQAKVWRRRTVIRRGLGAR